MNYILPAGPDFETRQAHEPMNTLVGPKAGASAADAFTGVAVCPRAKIGLQIFTLGHATIHTQMLERPTCKAGSCVIKNACDPKTGSYCGQP